MAPTGSSRTSSRMKARRKLQPRRSHNFQYKKKHHHHRCHHHHHHPQSNDNRNEEIIIPTGLPPAASCSSSMSSNTNNNESPKHRDISAADDDEANIEVSSTSGCSTPKAQKFRIPEISTCPPPPKKPKPLSNCSLHRSPIAFFAPPELELFFLVALSDISV